MSTVYTVPSGGTTITDFANSQAAGFGVDPGYVSAAMILLNGNISPDMPIPAGTQIHVPTMTELATFMSTGTLPIVVSAPASTGMSTTMMVTLAVAALGLVFVLSK